MLYDSSWGNQFIRYPSFRLWETFNPKKCPRPGEIVENVDTSYT